MREDKFKSGLKVKPVVGNYHLPFAGLGKMNGESPFTTFIGDHIHLECKLVLPPFQKSRNA